MFDAITFDAVRALKDAVLAKLAITTKPLRITEYTNGVGVHNIHPESTYQIITLVGGGGAGGRGNRWSTYDQWGCGGNSGEELHRRVNLSGAVPYEVGAANGGKTKLGTFEAKGGYPGGNASVDQNGVVTQPDTTPTLGKTSSKAGSISGGGDSTMGVGGKSSAGAAAAEPGGGYGAGGGGGRGDSTFNRGANGSGGFIRIEEY